jgi:hypothetical protein
MKTGGQVARRDEVEILVIALDPVDRRREGFVPSGCIGYVADAQPERDVRMPSDDPACLLESPVDVAERPKTDQPALVVAAGTSRSALSQMKSFLLYTASS